MKTVDEILIEARSLSEGDRLSLASRLLEFHDPAASKDINIAWSNEIRERIRRYEAGETRTFSASDVFREADQRLGL